MKPTGQVGVVKVEGYFPRKSYKVKNEFVLPEIDFNRRVKPINLREIEPIPDSQKQIGFGFWTSKKVVGFSNVKNLDDIFYVNPEEGTDLTLAIRLLELADKLKRNDKAET